MSKQFENPASQNGTLQASQSHTALSPSTEFSADQRRTLLRIAHDAILSALDRQPLSDAPPSLELAEPRGVFTTLYLPGETPADHQLRGCVGYALPVVALFRAVAETARAAAFEDSRFPPVTREEALKLEVSLSILSRLFSIQADAVEVGRHGLLISEGFRRGLLLPQVPLEHGWDRETFLDQTCRKAGLPLDAWRRSAGIKIEAFTADVFGDLDRTGTAEPL
jgi:AmmeMemoRadiSam system protein A